MSTPKEFRPMPTFEALHDQLQELKGCVTAQSEVIQFLLDEMIKMQATIVLFKEDVRELNLQTAFLMSLIRLNVPTSKIADASGKIPVIAKFAAQIYAESGRDAMLKRFNELDAMATQQEAEIHGQGLPPDQGSPEGSDTQAGDAPLVVTFPTRTTH